MSWLINTAATPILTIGTTDYSNNLVNFSVSDTSVVNTGIVTTQGRVVLAELPGQTTLLDYDKTKFPRGTAVQLDLRIDGVTRRHPRGSLYILDSSYNNNERTIELNVGCLLTIYNLTEHVESIKDQTIFDLSDEATIQDLNNALMTERSFIYVDGNGSIQKKHFFGSDGLGSNKEAAGWVSVRDHTAISSQPLGVGGIVPDKLLVTYTWLEDGTTSGTGDVDGTPYSEDISESQYFLEHPANLKTSQRICEIGANGVTACSNKEVWDGKRVYSVKKTSTDRTYYGGPGGSTTTQTSVVVGPAVELNGSYYAELYSYEVARNGGNINGVQLKGLTNITQSTSEKEYFYGEGGELLKTIDRQYKNKLGAMANSDWRAGYSVAYENTGGSGVGTFGAQRGFLTLPPISEMYLSTQVVTEWEYYDDRTIEKTTTDTSSADCNNVGIYIKEGGRQFIDIEATTNGVRTYETRTSIEGQANPVQPDRVGDGTAGKISKAETVEDVSSRYQPTAAGSYTEELDIPYQVNTDKEEDARERAVLYARYIRDLIEGDSQGIRVAEAMRPEIFNFYPGMPFSFYDRTIPKLIKLRMNACSWAVSETDAVMSVDGVMIGISNGTVNIGSNI